VYPPYPDAQVPQFSQSAGLVVLLTAAAHALALIGADDFLGLPRGPPSAPFQPRLRAALAPASSFRGEQEEQPSAPARHDVQLIPVFSWSRAVGPRMAMLGAGLTPTMTRWRFVWNSRHPAQVGKLKAQGTGIRAIGGS